MSHRGKNLQPRVGLYPAGELRAATMEARRVCVCLLSCLCYVVGRAGASPLDFQEVRCEVRRHTYFLASGEEISPALERPFSIVRARTPNDFEKREARRGGVTRGLPDSVFGSFSARGVHVCHIPDASCAPPLEKTQKACVRARKMCVAKFRRVVTSVILSGGQGACARAFAEIEEGWAPLSICTSL